MDSSHGIWTGSIKERLLTDRFVHINELDSTASNEDSCARNMTFCRLQNVKSTCRDSAMVVKKGFVAGTRKSSHIENKNPTVRCNQALHPHKINHRHTTTNNRAHDFY